MYALAIMTILLGIRPLTGLKKRSGPGPLFTDDKHVQEMRACVGVRYRLRPELTHDRDDGIKNDIAGALWSSLLPGVGHSPPSEPGNWDNSSCASAYRVR